MSLGGARWRCQANTFLGVVVYLCDGHKGKSGASVSFSCACSLLCHKTHHAIHPLVGLPLPLRRSTGIMVDCSSHLLPQFVVPFPRCTKVCEQCMEFYLMVQNSKLNGYLGATPGERHHYP